jgi:hypothetical protein
MYLFTPRQIWVFLQGCMLSVLILVANFHWLNDASYYVQCFHCQALNVDKWARVNQQPCWYLHLLSEAS